MLKEGNQDILRADLSRPLEGGASFSFRNRTTRLVWMLVWILLARWTPGIFNPWRVLLLKLFGAKISEGAAVACSAKIWLPSKLSLGRNSTIGPWVDCYDMAAVSIGDRTVISQRAVLCTGSHDISDAHFQLVAKPISIGNDVWVATEAFIGPGATVGNDAVIGARACLFGVAEPCGIYIGNPAKKIKQRNVRRD
jgi:putative colanic acid biosynthesis acetyltransferase WcaF